MSKGSGGTRTVSSANAAESRVFRTGQDNMDSQSIKDIIKEYDISIGKENFLNADGKIEKAYVVSYNFDAVTDKKQMNELSALSKKMGGSYDSDMDAFYMQTQEQAQTMVNELAKSILKKK